jgi:hypothetical protein
MEAPKQELVITCEPGLQNRQKPCAYEVIYEILYRNCGNYSFANRYEGGILHGRIVDVIDKFLNTDIRNRNNIASVVRYVSNGHIYLRRISTIITNFMRAINLMYHNTDELFDDDYSGTEIVDHAIEYAISNVPEYVKDGNIEGHINKLSINLKYIPSKKLTRRVVFESFRSHNNQYRNECFGNLSELPRLVNAFMDYLARYPDVFRYVHAPYGEGYFEEI